MLNFTSTFWLLCSNSSSRSMNTEVRLGDPGRLYLTSASILLRFRLPCGCSPNKQTNKSLRIFRRRWTRPLVSDSTREVSIAPKNVSFRPAERVHNEVLVLRVTNLVTFQRLRFENWFGPREFFKCRLRIMMPLGWITTITKTAVHTQQRRWQSAGAHEN